MVIQLYLYPPQIITPLFYLPTLYLYSWSFKDQPDCLHTFTLIYSATIISFMVCPFSKILSLILYTQSIAGLPTINKNEIISMLPCKQFFTQFLIYLSKITCLRQYSYITSIIKKGLFNSDISLHNLYAFFEHNLYCNT